MKPALSIRSSCLCALASAVLLCAFPAGAEDLPAKLGPDFQVNRFVIGSQDRPDVARYPDGRFVVVWQNDGALPSNAKGRLYQASGAAAGDEFLVSDHGSVVSPPQVTILPDGGFAVVWADFHNVYLRRFDHAAQPLGDSLVVNGPGSEPNEMPDVAVDSAGRLAVVWHRDGFFENPVLLRRFDAAGNPEGGPVQVNTFLKGDPSNAHVAVNDAGSVLVSWTEDFGFHVMARRFDGPSGAWSEEVTLAAPFSTFRWGSSPVLYPEGDGAVVFGDLKSSAFGVFVQRLDAQGKRAGEAVDIGGDFTGFGDPEVAVDADGNALVVWSALVGEVGDGAQILGRLLDRSWHPLGEAFAVSASLFPRSQDVEPAVAVDASGGFAVVWSNGQTAINFPILPPPQITNGRDGSSYGVFGQLLGDAGCVGDGESLCLGRGNRFRVKASWKVPSGETGAGHARRLTADTGALWYFGSSNLEVMVKILDARAVNGHFWLYLGSLSNVEYNVTVTDTATGQEKTYRNPPRRFSSLADVRAFADGTPVGSSAPQAASPPAVLLPQISPVPGTCFATAQSLCLAAGRFRGQVDFVDPRTDEPGRGRAIPLTGDTGTFWFFDPKNLEVMVKVLDGRAVNGSFWVLFGGLSDVKYTITVTDIETGNQRTYVNPRGRLASHADVEAFPPP